MIEKKTYFKVGLDLATRKIGIAILDQDNKLFLKDKLDLLEWEDKNIIPNIATIDSFVKSLKINQPFIVGIEVANFKNPQITQRFSYYAGVFTKSFHNWYPEEFQELKLFNANAWQFLVGCKPNDERATRKAIARDFARDNCFEYNDEWTEDECDAYCISFLLNKIISTNQLYVNNQKKRTVKGYKQAEISRIQKKIITRLEKISSLDQIRNKKQVNRLNNEINDLYDEKARVIEEIRALCK